MSHVEVKGQYEAKRRIGLNISFYIQYDGVFVHNNGIS